LAARLVLRPRHRDRGRVRLVRALASLRPGARPGGHHGRARRARADRLRAAAQRQADDGHRADLRRGVGRRPGLRGRRAGRADLEPLLRPGPVDPVADGGLGRGRHRGRAAAPRHPRTPGPRDAGRGVRNRRAGLRRRAQLLDLGDVHRRSLAGRLRCDCGDRAALRHRPCRRKRRLRARVRPGAPTLARALPAALRGDLAARGGDRDPAGRRRRPAPPRPGRRGGNPAQLSGACPERRRRLGPGARAGLLTAVHGLGFARPGRERAQSARRPPWR
jgi:hypothetical protein